jgi:chromosome segregation ATPase
VRFQKRFARGRLPISLAFLVSVAGFGLPVRAASLIERIVAVGDVAQTPQLAEKQTQGEQPAKSEDVVQLKKTIQRLNSEVQRLRKRVADLEREHELDSVQDRMTREQQRSETLQMRLTEIREKEAGLQNRMDEIDDQARPENIERSLVGVGSLRPEETRDAIRRRLLNEKQRIQVQVNTLRQERSRLNASLADSDAAVQRLRQRLGQN